MMPVAAWIWVRARKPRWPLALVAFAGGLVAQAAWVHAVVVRGPTAVLDADLGLGGWGAWSLGVAGMVALCSGLVAGLKRGVEGMRDPDRAFEVAVGLFGTGVLLQQIARALA
jgi:hypothetical protein